MKIIFVSYRNGEIIEDKERKKEGPRLGARNANLSISC